MTKGSARIRWTEDERNTVLTEYRTLHTREPDRDTATLFAMAQKALPPKRRRTLIHKLRVWLGSEGAEASGRPQAANVVSVPSTEAATSDGSEKREGRANAPITTGSVSASISTKRTRRRDDAHAAPIVAAANLAVLEKLLVERGSEIVAAILESTRVQQALRALLSAASPTMTSRTPVSVTQPGDGGSVANKEADTDSTGNGKLRVLIAGMDKHEGTLFAKTYDDTLELDCWSADEGLELLRTAVDRADVVVGMTNLLSQPVEQTVRRHAKRYLRNTRGVAGLRGELANLALSGDPPTAAEGGAARQA